MITLSVNSSETTLTTSSLNFPGLHNCQLLVLWCNRNSIISHERASEKLIYSLHLVLAATHGPCIETSVLVIASGLRWVNNCTLHCTHCPALRPHIRSELDRNPWLCNLHGYYPARQGDKVALVLVLLKWIYDCIIYMLPLDPSLEMSFSFCLPSTPSICIALPLGWLFGTYLVTFSLV